MNFIACEGNWVVSAGSPVCEGNLVSYTGSEMRTVLGIPGQALTAEDADLLFWSTVGLFITVFGFLVLKKVL